MGHHIHAIVARDDIIARVPGTFPQARIVPLAQGFSMVPLTTPLLDALDAAYPAADGPDGFLHYDCGVPPFLLELSEHGGVAYVETDYESGVGTQGAVVLEDGEVVLERAAEESFGAINAAMKRLGVRAGSGIDEFSAVGLFRYRTMAAWEPAGS